MIGFYDYTVIATYVSLASSVAGIILAASGKPIISVFCLLLSGLLDTFDGKIARTKKDRSLREQRFGVQIDSLCDLVCFGVLPAVIGYAAAPIIPRCSVLFVAYVAVSSLYILGGLIRLSFFNISEEEARESGEKTERKTYTGMPITTSALVFPLVYLVKLIPGVSDTAISLVWMGAMLAVGFCFVGKFRVRKPTNKGAFALIGLGVLIAIAVGVVYGITHK